MKYLIFLLITLFPTVCYATIDALCVNNITKELYSFELESNYFGIGWKTLGEGDEKVKIYEKYYLDKGYKYVSFPYKIEIILLSLFIIVVGFLINKKRNIINYVRKKIF